MDGRRLGELAIDVLFAGVCLGLCGWGVAVVGSGDGATVAPSGPEYKAAYLTAYWSMEEETGDDRRDRVDDNDLAEMTNTILQSSGILTYCAALDTSLVRYFTGGIDADYEPTTGVAVSFWEICSTGYTTSVGIFGTADIIIYGTVTGGERRYYFKVYQSDGTLKTAYATSTDGYDSLHHVVCVASNSNITVYINNVAGSSTAYDNTIRVTGSSVLRAGWSYEAGVGKMDGSLDEVGLWKDITFTGSGDDTKANFVDSLYNSGTPPHYSTIAGGTDEDCVLLLHFNGADESQDITDSAMGGYSAPYVITASGNASIETGTKKFGTGSLELDGTGDYIDITPSSTEDWNFGTGNITVEYWFYTGSGSTQHTTYWRVDNSNQLVHDWNDTGYGLWFYWNGTGGEPNLQDTDTWNDSTWHHCAHVRNGNDWTVYIDGVQEDTQTNSGGLNVQDGSLRIGANYLGTVPWTGFIDEFRLSTRCVYGGNFSVPTGEFSP